MADLLDIQVETITPDEFAGFDRIATVDVQPHYFGGLLPRVDLVVDHHPEQPGYTAVFKDIRADYGSTCTILTEHLRAVDVNISERTATAMLYAIKSDTLFFARQTNRVDLEAFSFLYPLADPALIRKMEGAEITLERLEHVTRALATSRLRNQVFSAFLGETTREDFIPYTADFLLQVEDVKWTIVSGIVGGQLIVSVRNLGYSRNAGEFVKANVRRHRQRRRPPRDGQGRGADRAVPREVRRPVRRRHRRPHRRAGRAVPQRTEQTTPDRKLDADRHRPAWLKLASCSTVSSAPDRDPRSGRPACSSPTDSRIMPRVTPAAASCSSVKPYCDVSTGRLQRLSMPPRLAARWMTRRRSNTRHARVVAAADVEADHAAEAASSARRAIA